uniref:Thaumatin-like protein n=1 Tax=Oryza brachyantha TaxID=4533 RepID=J3LRC7_ORYBR
MAPSILLPLFLLVAVADAATFTITNRCQYTVWPAAVPSGGGAKLDPGQTWTIDVPAGTTGGRGGPRCAAAITPQCPGELRAAGGCNSACTVFREDKYCCTGSAANSCGPTSYSEFFKRLCPDAYSYPKDDPSSTYTCPGGTNYHVIFCP